MRERVIQQSSTDPTASRALLNKMLSTDSDEVSCMDLEISLRDPVAMTRIRTPAKGLKCDHLQCFDLDIFLEFARR
ncbi:hypothetical protein T484DRAFT_1792314, partial [Baffinella frigidus]